MDRTVRQWCGGGRLKCAHYIKKPFSMGPFLHLNSWTFFPLCILNQCEGECFLFEGEKDFFLLKRPLLLLVCNVMEHSRTRMFLNPI